MFWNLVNPGYGPIALNEGVGVPPVTFADVMALNPELAFDPSQSGSAFQERTGASATTPSADGDAVGTFKNFGTKGNHLTAAADNQRPIMRASGSLRYLEWDGVDDYFSEATMAALRSVPGWTMIAGVRNTGSTATVRMPLLVKTGGAVVGRASQAFAQTTGAAYTSGRRLNGDAGATAMGLPHANADIVLTGIGDFANTDAFVRSNGVEEGSNTSWLTPGVTDNDGGEAAMGGFVSANIPFAGRIYSAFVFPSVLSAANLRLVERYVAQTMGITI